MAQLKFNEIFQQLEERLKNLKSILKSLDKDITGQGIKGYETGVRGLIDAQKAAEKVQKDLNEARKKGINVNKEAIKEADKLAALNKERVNQLRREQREEAKLVINKQKINELRKKEILSDKQLIELNRRLINQRANLVVKTKAQRVEYKKLTNEIVRNEKVIRKNDKSIGRFQRNVGNYTSSLKGLASQLGVTFGLLGLFRVFKNMGKIFQTFEKDVKRLQAIIGTGINIDSLTKQAKDLGSSTVFTANQIVALQTELAKLGFTVNEILSSTTGIQALAAATGIELAEAATIAGSALKIFGLDAAESARVADVLAKSTSLSALDMQKLATALPVVGTTARIAGQSIERTTALLGILADRGLDASTSATSLRNIFLELSKQGISMEDALEKINNATDKNNTSLQLFGKRSAAAGVILAENVGTVNDLEEALINADGAAQDMADTMLDNLAGDITLAQSAWEGFVLSVEDGDGAISTSLRNIVSGFTRILNKLNELNKFGDTISKRASDAAQKRVDEFKVFIENVDEEEKKRRLMIRFYELERDITKEQKILDEDRWKLFDEFGQEAVDKQIDKVNALERERLLLIQLGKSGFYEDQAEDIKTNTDAVDENTEALKKNVKERKKLIEPEVLTGAATGEAARGGDVGLFTTDVGQRTTDAAEAIAFAINKVEDKQKETRKGSFIGRLLGFGDPSQDEQALTQSIVQLWGAAMNAIGDMTQNELDHIQDLLQLQDEAIAKTMDLLDTEEDRIKKLNEAGQAFSTKEKERLQEKLQNEKAARQKTLQDEIQLKKKQQRLSIAQAAIDVASAVLSIWAQKGGNFYVKLAQSIIFGAIGAFQVSAIKSQKFATGTDSVPLNGAKPGIDTVHAQLTEGEGVIQKSVNKKIPYHKGFKRTMIPAAAEMYLNGMKGDNVYMNDNEIGNGYLKGIEKNTRNDLVYDSMGKLKMKKVGKNKFYYN